MAHNEKLEEIQEKADELLDRGFAELRPLAESRVREFRRSLGSCDFESLLNAYADLRQEREDLPEAVRDGSAEDLLDQLIRAAPEGVMNRLLVCIDESLA